MPNLSQTYMMASSPYQALDYTLSACPCFAHQLANGQEQVSIAFQRPKNDPIFPY